MREPQELELTASDHVAPADRREEVSTTTTENKEQASIKRPDPEEKPIPAQKPGIEREEER